MKNISRKTTNETCYDTVQHIFSIRDRIDRWFPKKAYWTQKCLSNLAWCLFDDPSTTPLVRTVQFPRRHVTAMAFLEREEVAKKKEEDRSEKISREKDKNDGAQISILLNVMDKMRLGLRKALVICPTIIAKCRTSMSKLTNAYCCYESYIARS